jgi:LAO/AO transport system kinase
MITLAENAPREAYRLLSGVEAPADGPESAAASRPAHVLGITGPPGVGKSTLVNAMMKELRRRDASVAVLAVDPSSPFAGGALLGDRISMNEHAGDPGVYIRSMATRGMLGGLARAAWLAIRILGIWGFDWIIVETAGVGQSEIDIVDLADTTVLVLSPALGDDVQVMKAGIMEVADLFVINKSDLPGAERMRGALRSVLARAGGDAPGSDTAAGDADSLDGPDGPEVHETAATAARAVSGVPELTAALEERFGRLRATNLIVELRLRRHRTEVRRLVLSLLDRHVERAMTNGGPASGRGDPLEEALAIVKEMVKTSVWGELDADSD